MADELRLMAVHAHPDDEVIPTGGVLARCAAEGIETVLVTCTDGRHGFAEGFANPGEPGHDPTRVAAKRNGELERSCELLGVTHLERLGYGDSGMAGWATNADSLSFCNVDLEEATARVVALMERYRPQVVLTYDERDGLGHPDHVMAHRVALAAVERSGIPVKLYLTVRSKAFTERMDRAREALNWESPRPTSGRPPRPRRSDEEITTTVETADYAVIKGAALAAHDSQLTGSHWLLFPEETLREVFCEETFIRVKDGSGASLPESDLFAGLREAPRASAAS